MLAKALRWVLGVALLPVDAAYSAAFTEALLGIRRVGAAQTYFLLGITGYLAFHALVTVPSRAYVLGHELTHAAAAWVSGGKVTSMKVGSKRGSVTTNRLTALVALAPYLVPVYSILWAVGFGIVGMFQDTSRWTPAFFFGLGATLTFHLVFTVSALKQKQSDLETVGPLLGLGLIFLCNLVLVMGAISLVTPQVRFGSFLLDGLHRSRALYQQIISQLLF